MANSFVSVRAVEGQTTFPFYFPNGYLSEDHIRTYVDGVEVSRTISSGTAIIDPVAAEQEVVVARHSPQTPYISFEDGSILNKQNIDVQNRHAFMLAEEAAEQRDFFALGDIDMNYHKIIHVAPGTDQYDVVNKGQFDYFISINEDMAERAETAAEAAEASAQTASNAAAGAAVSEGNAADSAEFAADTVAGFDAHAADKKAEVTAEGDTQVARVIAEGDVQFGRAKTQADRAQGYAEILERPYEDMGAHQIQQGYPPVPSFSSMWMVIDGGLDPVDGVTMWNAGDILLYSVQATAWSRMSGAILGGGGDPLPVEILDDLIMQQGKKIRFRVDEFVDTVGLELDADGDVVVGEIPTTPSTGTPAAKLGLAATEVYHVTGTDASGNAVKHKILTEATGLKNSGVVTHNGKLIIDAEAIDTNNPLVLETGPGKANFILAKIGEVNDWYLGVGSDGSHDVLLSSYTHSNNIALKSDHILLGKDPRSNAAQGMTASSLTRKDFTDTTYGGKAANNSWSGANTFTNANPINLQTDALQIIRKLNAAGTRKWYLGEANSSGDVAVYNDHHATGIVLKGNSEVSIVGVPTTSEAQSSLGNSLTRKDWVDGSKRAKHAGNLATGSDWNTVLTPGMYSVALFGSNAPVDTYTYGTLVVEGDGAHITQMYWPDSSASPMAWRSTYSGSGGWRPWQYVGRAPKKVVDLGGVLSGTADMTGYILMSVLVAHAGRNYPMVFPAVAGDYWIKNRGGENADRDYDIGVRVAMNGAVATLTCIAGSNHSTSGMGIRSVTGI